MPIDVPIAQVEVGRVRARTVGPIPAATGESVPDPSGRVQLRGWGRATGSHARYLTGPPTARAVVTAGERGVIARGGGRGYGDAATNAGGTVLDTTTGAAVRRLDTERGVLVADAGVPLRDLLAACLPAGWVPPVLPGTGYATVGGALAADVHGKNHVACGSFGAHVIGLTLLTGTGEVLELRPAGDDPRFWATVGGMGLTGVIQQVELRLRRAVPLSSRRVRAGDLDAVLSVLDQAVAEPGVHAVAWLDGWARGAALGRGLVEVSSPAAGGLDQPARAVQRRRSWGARATHRSGTIASRAAAALPGAGLAGTPLIRVANQARWRMAGTGSATARPLGEVLFPLDAADAWPSAFGRGGLVQYQFAVPDTGVRLLAETLERLQRAGIPPALVVLKRFGQRVSPAPLSFPLPGWTLALDLPAAAPGLGAVLDRLDDEVASAGGRVYLAKDARARPEALAAMYPGLARWREVRDAMDPDGRFHSDLARRLCLVGGPRRACVGSVGARHA